MTVTIWTYTSGATESFRFNGVVSVQRHCGHIAIYTGPAMLPIAQYPARTVSTIVIDVEEQTQTHD